MKVREGIGIKKRAYAAGIAAIPLKYRLALNAIECYLSTCRVEVSRSRCAERIFMDNSKRKGIVVLWHSDLIYTLYHFRHVPSIIMTSASRDGEWISRVIQQWGQYPVRGSRHKGGVGAIGKMATAMTTLGLGAGIVADGSTGPAGTVQIGGLILARRTGCPIVPVGVAASRAIYFHTWDRMVLPLPFSRVCLVYGDMFTVPANARGGRLEYFRDILKKNLDRAGEEARRRVGLVKPQ